MKCCVNAVKPYTHGWSVAAKSALKLNQLCSSFRPRRSATDVAALSGATILRLPLP